MRIIVTGGAGFIGSQLVDRLLTEGAEVTAVDNFDPFYDRAIKESNLIEARQEPTVSSRRARHPGCAAQRALVQQFRPDAIVHLAARAGVRPSIDEPRLYADVNVLGTLAFLEAACRLEPRPRFVYASSSSVYGDRASGPFRESDPVDLPVSPYAATKTGLRALGPHVSPPARTAGDGTAVLHGLWPTQSPGSRDREVYPADRPGPAGADVR